jgi:hypothetical protein
MKNSLATEGEEWIRKTASAAAVPDILRDLRTSAVSPRGCVYPLEVSRLCRQRTEKFSAPHDRGLTARPVVLAKTYEPGASRSRREVAIRAARFPEKHSRSASGDARGFAADPSSGSRFDPVSSCSFCTVEGFVGCLDDFFGR